MARQIPFGRSPGDFDSLHIKRQRQAAGAGGLQPSSSDEVTFTAQTCDVDSHNAWYKRSVRSSFFPLAE